MRRTIAIAILLGSFAFPVSSQETIVDECISVSQIKFEIGIVLIDALLTG